MANSETTLFERVYAMNGSGGARELDRAQIDRSAGGDPLWLILNFSRPDTCDWIVNHAGVDPLVADALLADDARPRCVNFDSGLLIVLRGVNTNPGADPEDMVSIRLWIEADRVIATRRRQLLSVQDVIDRFASGTGPKSPVEVLTALVERLADRIGDYVESIEEEVGACEDEVGASNYTKTRPKLAKLRRHIAAVRRFLAPQRDALDRLYRQGSEVLGENTVNQVREEADRITRNLEDLDLAREHAIVLQEELLSQLAVEQNSRLFVLSIVAAVFLPLSFVTGLFGMNVAGLPGTENPQAFALLMGSMIVTVAALVAIFRWMKWL